MYTLKNFEKELNKCSKCGLCQQACPIFELSKNDCTVSKGKFTMLLGVAKGDLKFSKNINKYIDLCLKCTKCNTFCPSTIDVCQILNIAKHDYTKGKFYFKLIHFIQNKKLFLSTINFLSTLTKPFRKNFNTPKNPTLKVLYFKGCVNKISPNTDNYIYRIFNNSNIEIIEPDFDCCGLPFLSEGNLERFEECAKFNIEKLKENYDYLVTDCASCEDTILNYNKYINFDFPIEKSVNWGHIIATQNIKFIFDKPVKITFHKPCHLKDDSFLEKIIKNCKNVEYLKMGNYDSCCGFAGTFALKNYKLASKLLQQKTKNIINTNADYVITTCPSCLFGLKYGLKKSSSKIRVVSLLEFLSKADKIIY